MGSCLGEALLSQDSLGTGASSQCQPSWGTSLSFAARTSEKVPERRLGLFPNSPCWGTIMAGSPRVLFSADMKVCTGPRDVCDNPFPL